MACASLQIQFRFRFKICMRNQDALADGCRARLHHTSRSSSQDFLPRKANQKYLVKANERPIYLEPSQKTHVITQAANFVMNMGFAVFKHFILLQKFGILRRAALKSGVSTRIGEFSEYLNTFVS